MPEISNNPQFNTFATGSFSRASQDSKISPNEVRQLKNTISQMQSLSGADKAAVNQIIDGLGSATTEHNFFRTRREISAVDMAVLETVASENPLAEQLLNQFKVSSQPQQQQRIVPTAEADSAPSSVSFPRPTTTTTNVPTPITSNTLQAMRPEWYLNQYNTGLPSHKGDCGPTSAAMIARSFGFQTNLSEADVVELSRDVSGGPQSGPPWAISTPQISRAVSRLTGGQVREVSQNNYRAGDGQRVLRDITESLSRGQRPILLSGVPGDVEQPYRHYMTAVGPDPRVPGNILFADPALQFQDLEDGRSPALRSPGANAPSARQPFTRSLSPEDVNDMIRRDLGRGTTVINYGRAAG